MPSIRIFSAVENEIFQNWSSFGTRCVPVFFTLSTNSGPRHLSVAARGHVSVSTFISIVGDTSTLISHCPGLRIVNVIAGPWANGDREMATKRKYKM